jgi:two-component system, NtrC family, response regulator AlgB
VDILLIDDDASLRRTIRTALETGGHQVVEARDKTETFAQLETRAFDAALLDLRLSKDSGLDMLPDMVRLRPGLSVVIITAYAAVDTAVEAMRRGAFDYLPKPFTPDQLRLLLERISRVRRLENRVRDLEEQIREVAPEADLHTEDARMRQILDIAFKAAASEATILLRGESGTGKGVLARALHAHSSRAAGPFVTVHCPSLSAELLESELFGHVRGAFTGAVRDTRGKVSAAEGGTLFLDEIGDMSLQMQVKLLRVLQERSFERVGSNRTMRCNVRIIAATHRDLDAAITAGRFREDLYYRLNVFPIQMPPLRERLEDLPVLIEHLVQRQGQISGRHVRLDKDAMNCLARNPWPGNVRELANLLERLAILFPEQCIGAADLPERYRSMGGSTWFGNGVRIAPPATPRAPVSVSPALLEELLGAGDEDLGDGHDTVQFTDGANFEFAGRGDFSDRTRFTDRGEFGDRVHVAAGAELAAVELPQGGMDLKDHLSAIEIGLIRKALVEADGTVAEAARLLRMRRTTLVEKLRKYRLSA